MKHTKLDSALLSSMLLSGYRYLRRNTDTIDDLNVFPVPDGDTGTNMTMTLGGGVSACSGAPRVDSLMQAFSRGTLFSARGNSGVILSQFVRGFGIGCEGKENLTISDFADAFASGVAYAYESVIKPVEGTMLTVMRETSEYLNENRENFTDFESLFTGLKTEMNRSLAHTPELLPVLKEAGVIDSGGAGFLCIFEGMEMALNGIAVEDDDTSVQFSAPSTTATFGPDSELLYGYCTEFILQLQNSKTDIPSFSIKPVIQFLETLGDSIVAVADGDIVKVHVHTFTPEKVIEYARRFGEFISVKIENMSVQHSEVVASKEQAEPREHTRYAVAAVASGDGITEYFKEIGVSEIITGGQTNNPSIEDLICAFDKLDCDHIIMLPNNSNIVMTARQAAELYNKCDVRVIPTKSIAEGYSALSMMDLSADTVDEVIDGMTAYLGDVTTGYVTTATRDTEMNGVSVKRGDYIGLDNNSILCATDDKVSAAMQMLKNLPDIDDKQVITVFSGADVTEAELDTLKSGISAAFPLVEAGYIDGGQEVYSFILAIE